MKRFIIGFVLGVVAFGLALMASHPVLSDAGTGKGDGSSVWGFPFAFSHTPADPSAVHVPISYNFFGLAAFWTDVATGLIGSALIGFLVSFRPPNKFISLPRWLVGGLGFGLMALAMTTVAPIVNEQERVFWDQKKTELYKFRLEHPPKSTDPLFD